jgi:predicted LPLAT superfamily acyltransferase
VRPRELLRIAARQEANAALCRLPLAEYLALPRRERRRRLQAARDREAS